MKSLTERPGQASSSFRLVPTHGPFRTVRPKLTLSQRSMAVTAAAGLHAPEGAVEQPALGGTAEALHLSLQLSSVSPTYLAVLPLALIGLSLAADPSWAGTPQEHAIPLFTLAEGGENFWGNVLQYGRYFVTVMLGTGYVMLRPLQSMMKSPVTAVLGIAGIVGALVAVKLVVDAMLGLREPFSYDM